MKKYTIFTFILMLILFSCSKKKQESEIQQPTETAKTEIPAQTTTPKVSGGTVVLNGMTISEDRITRNNNGDVIGLNLGRLGISDSNCLKGIEKVSKTIENLDLSFNDLTAINLAFLSSCYNLKILNLQRNWIKGINLKPISNCNKLESLNIAQNSLNNIDLTALKSMRNLKSLYFFHNYLIDIDFSPIMSKSTIKELDFSDNDLSSNSKKQICDFKAKNANTIVKPTCI